MIPVLFKIGPLAINSFGVMAMLGFLIPTLLLRKEFIRKNLDPDIANGIVIAAMIGGFLGARIYYILERWDGFLANPLDYVFTGAGLVWYGGLLGGFGAGVLYVHRKNISIPYAIQPLSYFDGHGPNHHRVFQNHPESFYGFDDGATD
ncbi:prolipoprotein diacylglyceryl transferase [candidate division KSB1 bacterium]|nr:prolipoprotein diacylglyceryl transferase [candidate division KSB1 bacterium]